MSPGLVFWAQAFDNTVHDHVRVGGREVALEDVPQEVLSRVSKVIKGACPHYAAGAVRLTYDRGPCARVPSQKQGARGH